MNETLDVLKNMIKILADPILEFIVKHRVLSFIIAIVVSFIFARFNILTWVAGILLLAVVITIGKIPLEASESLTAITILLYLIGFIVTIPIAIAMFGYVIYKVLVTHYQKLAMQYAEISPEDLVERKKPKSVTIILGDE